MSRRQPAGGQAPVLQRVRVRYAKRGPLRFTSHRDFARALERALRRARIPMAFSQGFTPHPKISYASAAPTGAASEAEYLELGLQAPMASEALVTALDAALSPGLDVLDAVTVGTAGAGAGGDTGGSAGGPGGSLADRMEASRWWIALPGVEPETLRHAVVAFEAAPEVLVERATKHGRRTIDPRRAVVAIRVPEEVLPEGVLPEGVLPERAAPGGARRAEPSVGAPSGVTGVPCAILDCVVRQVTPSVRPDDVLSGLRAVADLEPPVPPRATRLAQGPLTAQGEIVDPLAADRGGMPTESVG